VFNMSLWTSELASSAIQIYYFPSIEAPVAHPTRLGYRLVAIVTFSVIVVACKLLSELASSAIIFFSFPCIEALVAHPTRLGYRLVSMVTFSVIFVACKLEVIRVINLLYHLSPQQFLT
jgi:hypothetical protein